MIYVFFGDDKERIDMYLENFLDKFFKDEDKEIHEFLHDKIDLDELLYELSSTGLGFFKKAITINFDSFAKSFKSLKANEKKEFQNVLNDHLNTDEELIIFVNYSKIDKFDDSILSIVPKENRKLLLGLEKNEWNQYVKKYFEKKNILITNEAVNEIIIRSDGSLRIFINEVNKLTLYKHDKIELDDVLKIFVKNKEDDVFALTSSLLEKNVDKSLEIYRDLRITQGIEPVTLITLLANNLIFLDQIAHLKSQNYSIDQIAQILKVKSGRVYYAFKNLSRFKQKDIAEILEKLYALDYKIKHSEVDRFYSFEIFISTI